MNQEAIDSTQNKSFPMRVVLLETGNRMYDLWLPETKEGRYVFDGFSAEISIMAENNEWVAAVGKHGYFISREGTSAKKLTIGDRFLVKAVLEGKNYTLYAELDRGRGNVFVPYYIERNADILIGRSQECDICYAHPFASRLHAVLRWAGDHWMIMDNDSKNGVFVNGKSIRRHDLMTGDVIYIMGLYIIMGTGFIAINNADNRILMTTPKIHEINSERDVVFAQPHPSQPADYFDRKPRKKYKLSAEPIEIELPPPPMGANKIPLALRLGSSAVMGGRALFTGNYLTALTSMVFPALTQGLTEKDRKEYDAKRKERYTEYLRLKQNEIAKEIKDEERSLNEIYPEINETMNFALTKTRLWERRKIDDDFLLVRLGSGNRSMEAELKYRPREFEMEPDPLTDEMYKVAEMPTVLHNVPIMLSLREDYITGVIANRNNTLMLVSNMISYLAVTHAFDELKMVILAEERDIAALRYVKYLPHFWDNEHSIRFVASTREDTQQLAKYLTDRWINEETPTTAVLNGKLKKQPAYVVFALNKELFNSTELLKNLLASEQYAGVSLVAAFDGVPKECSKLIDDKHGFRYIDLMHPEVEDLPFSADPVDSARHFHSMHQVMQTHLRLEEQNAELPSMITFLEMYGAGRVEHLNPIARWAANNPVKSLAAPLGVDTDGKLFYLDLHEKRQGPHGLVAGSTGSGKSEFIITYILSMAVNYSPEEVAFILIDYKGGGLADAFEDKARGIHLPHLVGTITNLDGSAIQRSLMSINSELKRRQAVFKKAKTLNNEGTMDIYDYQKLYRAGKVPEPMPHLFIISDEFAELKKQQPEFMDELISTARIGRSLGVHLILATQKPSGVVNDQIWSNTKFRVCLKVAERRDSMEMLKRPEAAELKNTGRFYLQVGYNEYFALGQSAWCGAGYYPQDEVVKEEDNSVEFVDTVGQIVLNARPKVQKAKADSKQVVAIVQYLSDLAIREKIKMDNLWREPLPAKLELKELAQPQTDYLSAVLGMVDDPEFQSQFPMELNLQSFHHLLMVGGSGSGKSAFLRTLLYSLITRYSPEEVNYYLVDLSAGALGSFRGAPHCGAYLTEESEMDFDRLLRLVKELVAERKKLFAAAEVFSYDAYLKVDKLPLVLFVLDGWMNLSAYRKVQEYSLSMADYLRESANYGIRFIITTNHVNELSAKIRQELDYRIMLQPKDKFDYNDVLNVRGSLLPPQFPGRGVCVVKGRPLEFHVAIPNVKEDDNTQNAMLKQVVAGLAEKYREVDCVKSLPVLDGVMEYAPLLQQTETDRILLGLSLETMQKVCMPLQQLYTASLYFGNPLGIRPVITNLLQAFDREQGDVIVMRRKADTIFNRQAEEGLKELFKDRFTLLDATLDGAAQLDGKVIENISSTKVMHRNAYCQQHGIPDTDRGRTKKAARYIRQHSKPLFVLFESLPDFLGLDLAPEQTAEFSAFFDQIKGYNVYFFGCFYPEDTGMTANSLFRSFAKEDFAMFFGGRFNLAWCSSLPSGYRQMDKVNPRYDRFVMKYHNECHRMLMPCGELKSAADDPDESDIV